MSSIISRSNCPCCNSASSSKVLACKDYTVSGEIFEIWECADCTLRFTQDVPDQHGIGKYYQSENYVSHTDTEKGLVNKLYKSARNYTLNWKMRLIERTTGKTTGALLDIGAGTGAFINRVISQSWLAIGLEPDEGARKVCMEKYNLPLQTPGRLFELNAGEFDVITMWHVLEHVHELHEYMEQIKKLLKKDGIAFIAVPNYISKDAGYYGSNWAAYDVPRHLYHFSPASVRKLASLHALNVRSVKPMWLDAFYIAMLSEGYKKGKTNLAAAVINGAMSNWNALKHREKCSSLVYIITRDEDIEDLSQEWF